MMRVGVGPIATWIVEDSTTSPVEPADDTEIASDPPTVIVTKEGSRDYVGEILGLEHVSFSDPLDSDIASGPLAVSCTAGLIQDEEVSGTEHALPSKTLN